MGARGLYEYFKFLIFNPKRLIKLGGDVVLDKAIILLIILSWLSVVGGVILLIIQRYVKFSELSFIGALRNLGIHQISYLLIIVILVIVLILLPIFFVLGAYLNSLILYLFMKFLKGSGTFKEVLYNYSVIIFPLYIVLGIISNILFVLLKGIDVNFTLVYGIIYLAVYVVLILYLTIVLKAVGRFSISQTRWCWIILSIIMGLFYISSMITVSGVDYLSYDEVLGSDNVLLQENHTKVWSDGPDKAKFEFAFVNYGLTAMKINISTFKISKGGFECDILNYGISAIMDEPYKIDVLGFFILDGFVEGDECGGEAGEEYEYEYSYEKVSGGKISGKVSGIFREFGKPGIVINPSDYNGTFPIINLNEKVRLNINENVIVPWEYSAVRISLLSTGNIGNKKSCILEFYNPLMDEPKNYTYWEGVPGLYLGDDILVYEVDGDKCDIVAYEKEIGCIDSDNTKVNIKASGMKNYPRGPDFWIRGNLTLDGGYVLNDACAQMVKTLDNVTGYNMTSYVPSSEGDVLMELVCVDGENPHRVYMHGCDCVSGACKK